MPCVTWTYELSVICYTTWLSCHVIIFKGAMWNPHGQFMWHHSIYHPTPSALKNMKFRLFRNPTKFDWVTRFHETIPIVTTFSSFEIYKNYSFSTSITVKNYNFIFIQKNCIFPEFYSPTHVDSSQTEGARRCGLASPSPPS